MTTDRFKLVPAVHLFLMRGDEVLLSLRENTGYEDGNYSVVAGHLDGGERVVDAAIREAKEEAGVELAPGDVEVVGVMHRKAAEERVDFFVTASNWRGSVVNCEPENAAVSTGMSSTRCRRTWSATCARRSSSFSAGSGLAAMDGADEARPTPGKPRRGGRGTC